METDLLTRYEKKVMKHIEMNLEVISFENVVTLTKQFLKHWIDEKLNEDGGAYILYHFVGMLKLMKQKQKEGSLFLEFTFLTEKVIDPEYFLRRESGFVERLKNSKYYRDWVEAVFEGFLMNVTIEYFSKEVMNNLGNKFRDDELEKYK